MKNLFLLFVFFEIALGANPKVVVLSLDGLSASLLSKEKPSVFVRLANEGASVKKLVPVFPSLTYPNHITMATGCDPSEHGIVANRFYDRQKGFFRYGQDVSFLQCEPIWTYVQSKGIHVWVDRWPMSYEPFGNIAIRLNEKTYKPFKKDKDVLMDVLKVLKEKNGPRLIMAYLHAVDSQGHDDGPVGFKTLKRLRQLNAHVEQFMDTVKHEVKEPFVLMVLSDHGMTEVKNTISTKSLLAKIKWKHEAVSSSAFISIHFKEKHDFDQIKKIFKNEKNVEVLKKGDNLLQKHHERMGDVMLVTKPPYMFESDSNDKFKKPPKGMHGYDPQHPDMAAVLFMYGAGVQNKAELDQASMLDVYPTLLHLLNVSPKQTRSGRVLKELF